jgi:hypothetical protein
MTMLSLAEAAEAVGKNRSTLFRAYRAGKMSAVRTEGGAIEVDSSELFRVFDPVAAPSLQSDAAPQAATVPVAPSESLNASLEVEVRHLRELLDVMREDRDQLRQDRDSWREQASRIVAALPPPPQVATPRKGFWRRFVA